MTVIDSVEKAIQIVNNDNGNSLREIYEEAEERALEPYYPFPFGVWFRGNSRASYKLVPTVFREPKVGGWYDEGMMLHHISLRNPSQHFTPRESGSLDLLCQLQHYNLPTRLLDFTESILIALYFAVANEDDDKFDGKVFALNARRLNAITRLHDPETSYICGYSSIDVIIRSEMAWARRKQDLRHAFIRNQRLETLMELHGGENSSKWTDSVVCLFDKWIKNNPLSVKERTRLFDLLRCPVAVFPSRLNPRMSSQSAMVLIYGGKVNSESIRRLVNDEDALLPEFRRKGSPRYDLERINGGTRDVHWNGKSRKQPNFLRSFSVPKRKKKEIREQLRRIGMHEAALFPEIDHVGNFVKREWSQPK